MIRTRVYRDGKLFAEDGDPGLISDYLAKPDFVVWLDLVHASPEELGLFQEEFGLHPLAVEDAAHSHQRPKVDRYRHHLFATVYAARLTTPPDQQAPGLHDSLRHQFELETAEVDVFAGNQYLITVRKDPVWNIEPVLKRWDEGESLLDYGVSFMLHALLDEIVDQYALVTGQIEERLDEVEEALLRQEPTGDLQRDLLELRRAVVGLRRVVLPLRESFHTLMESPILSISEEMKPYYGDIKDHVLRVGGDLEALQELLLNAIQLNMSISSNRLNIIMKQLTGWAAIIGVNTVIVGIYGMNFRLWPDGRNPLGFWIAIGVMLITSATFYVYFKKKDWL